MHLRDYVGIYMIMSDFHLSNCAIFTSIYKLVSFTARTNAKETFTLFFILNCNKRALYTLLDSSYYWT